MSVPLEELSSQEDCLRDALPSIFATLRHSDIWGVDLKTAEWQVLQAILAKFLRRHSAIPALQVSRANTSLKKTLEWRRFSKPQARLPEVETTLPPLDLGHITFNGSQYVLWVRFDEMVIKGYSSIQECLMPQGLMKLGLAVLEKLPMLLLQTDAGSGLSDHSASCVIEFKLHAPQSPAKIEQLFRKNACYALEELVTLIRHHYPNILGKAYMINPRDEYLAHLDIEDSLMGETIVLESPGELAQYLGPQIPPRYGGTGKSFAESDVLRRVNLGRDLEAKPHNETAEPNATASADTEKTGSAPTDVDCIDPESVEIDKSKLRLIYSETIGPPSIILDPDDLETARDLCPNKMGARIAFADSDTIVKFGHGVRLCEAEALHLVATRTTIHTPKLLSAYILDGVGYIVMSYEAGESFERYWGRVSKAEQDLVLEQLLDYVNQMREIKGDFIGGLDESPCRDGIFDPLVAGYGDYTSYSYGPYPSEKSFNEGIVQALRDRMPPKVLEHENDIESNFFNCDYVLYQTVRSLKNHDIVFTHGDLHPGNMLVRDDGTVVLLDWGLAGFWPEY